MIEPPGKIGIREYIAITVLIIGSKLADDTPTLFYKDLATAAWMAPIINGLLSIIPIYFLLKVITLYKGKPFIDILYRLLGKIGGFLILFYLFAVLTVLTIGNTAVYTNIIKDTYYIRTPTFAILGVLLIVCTYIAKKGLEQIGSISWIFLPYVTVALIGAVGIGIAQGNFSFIHPIFGFGIKELLVASTVKGAVYIDFLFLCFFASSIVSTNDFKKGTWISLGIVIVEASSALLSFLLSFDYKTVSSLNYPYHELLKYIRLGVFANVETIFFVFWLAVTFIRFSVYLYLIALIFGGLFKIKHFEYSIPIFATLFLFISQNFQNSAYILNVIRPNILFLTTPIFLILPIVLTMIAKIKGDFHHVQKDTT